MPENLQSNDDNLSPGLGGQPEPTGREPGLGGDQRGWWAIVDKAPGHKPTIIAGYHLERMTRPAKIEKVGEIMGTPIYVWYND
jgi:hypothetical protein